MRQACAQRDSFPESDGGTPTDGDDSICFYFMRFGHRLFGGFDRGMHLGVGKDASEMLSQCVAGNLSVTGLVRRTEDERTCNPEQYGFVLQLPDRTCIEDNACGG